MAVLNNCSSFMGLHLHANAWAPARGTNFSKNRVPKIGGRVNFLPSRYRESHKRVVLNAIDLLFGMPFIDLSRMEWMVAKIRRKNILFLADLAKFTKNALKLWNAT